MKCNETQGKWCKHKHGASKIIDTFGTYQSARHFCMVRWYIAPAFFRPNGIVT
jgi:hypothetical protein